MTNTILSGLTIDLSVMDRLRHMFGDDESDWPITPFKDGLTNRNFLVREGPQAVVLRVFGKESQYLQIDRDNEFAYAQAVAAASVGPRILVRGEHSALVEFIEGQQPGDEHLRDLRVIKAFTDSLRVVHGISPFGRVFDPAEYIRRYLEQARALGVVFSHPFETVWETYQRVEALAPEFPVIRVPSHNDPNYTNVIIQGGLELKAYQLDFEYAGLNDPYYDLGKHCGHHSLFLSDAQRVFFTYEPRADDDQQRRFHWQRARAWMWQVAFLLLQSTKKGEDFDYYSVGIQRMEEFLRVVEESSLLG
jgi:thiamine kinase-like enzyme